jgi:FAD/FMN-containing dehydrogenase
MAAIATNNFRASLRGNLLQPGDDGYEPARRVYNAMIDKRPALIAQCVDAADVVASVNFARQAGLSVAVRGGGHNGPGLGTVDDGFVIALEKMKGVRVDPAGRTARVAGGCTWGDVDHATSAFGQVTPSGFVSTTGVGGLTLGGGIGYLSRRLGLTIDNLLSVDMVLADGRFVTASEDENADLFWAIRGGGGNFGVVTSFEFRLHRIDGVQGGPMLWPLERAAEIMERWRDYILNAPEEINGWFGFLTVPPGPHFPAEHHGQKMCAIVWCDTGPDRDAEQRLTWIRRQFGQPAIDFAGPIPWARLQSLFDALYPPGLRWYWKADFFGDLTTEAIARHVEHAAKLPTMLSTAHVYPINGAVHRVASEATAFSFRDANFAAVMVGVGTDAASDGPMIAWAREYWDALHPLSLGGGYINMIMDEGEERIRAAFRGNYDRLVAVKRQYDPDNFYRVNQNIRPA